MAHPLDRSQMKRIKSGINGGSVKALKSPIERHHFLMNWNFDDGIKPLEFLIDQPDTDLGTITLLYWLLSPGYLYDHQDDPHFSLIKKIEKNIKQNFYTNKNISVDPSNNMGTNFLGEDANKKNLASIPQELTRSTPGDEEPLISLQLEYINKIYPLNQEDWTQLNKSFEKGIEILKEINENITLDSSVEDIIQAIDKYTKSRRPKDGNRKSKFDRKQVNDFKALDNLFAEQLVRKAKWKWYIHEMHEQVLDFRKLKLFSPGHKYMFDLHSRTQYYSDLNYGDGVDLLSYFSGILDIEKYEQEQKKQGLAFKRKRNPKYANTTDEQLLKILIKENVDKLRTIPYYEEKYGNLSDEDFYKENKGEIEGYIYGNYMLNGIYPFAGYLTGYSEFIEDKEQ